MSSLETNVQKNEQTHAVDKAPTRQHVFIIGSKGIPARYGGFESFVDKLTFYQKDKSIQYHVSCLVSSKEYDSSKPEFEHNGAHCFNIKELNIGPAKAIFYDLLAMEYCLKYIKANKIQRPIIYVLACRIGPFISKYKRKIRALGGKLFVNPDGHEWKRAKWSAPVRAYWKISERFMVKHADLLICDSKNIEKYIREDYKQYNPKTTYIAYGSETTPSVLADDDPKVLAWYQEKAVKPKEYYLVVGRFVPENNYKIMISEFMKSKTKKDFVLITNHQGVKYYDTLKKEIQFEKDPRIKFVGTVYDQELLKKIRENAYGYLHGHEVGGTNPSLLEALGSTDLNLLLDVGFNREVAKGGAVYWSKQATGLAGLLENTDMLHESDLLKYGRNAKDRIECDFSWDSITSKYEACFGGKGYEGAFISGNSTKFI